MNKYITKIWAVFSKGFLIASGTDQELVELLCESEWEEITLEEVG